MNPRFSIIIPVYNVAPYLRECLDSVLAQTFTDWEAICVDDGSTDGSGAILDEYATRDARFRVIHQKNAGVSVARNKGMSLARGEWLWFVDGDDVLVRDALSRCDKIVRDGNCDAYLFKHILRFKDGTAVPLCANGTFDIVQIAHELNERRSLLCACWRLDGYPFIRLLRREKFAGILFPPGIVIMEDSWNLVRMLSVSACWGVVDGAVYCYRERSNSVSMALSNRLLEQEPMVCMGIMNDVKKLLHMTRRERQIVAGRQFGFLSYCMCTAGNVLAPAMLRKTCLSYFIYLILYNPKKIFSLTSVRCLLWILTGGNSRKEA